MFANLTYEDKVAFFDLLDEYFASRPHLLATASAAAASSPISSTSGSRTLPPPASNSSRTLPPLTSPTSPPPRVPSASGGGFGGFGGGTNGEKPDMATKLLLGGIKMGTSGARTGLGMLSKNQAAMDALGKVGAAAIVNSAHGSLNKAGGKGQGQGEQSPTSPTEPVPQQHAAMVSPPPSRGPPPRRTPTAPPAEMAQAQAMYDYDAADSGDLGVQSGQVIYVVQKTSADYCKKIVKLKTSGWTCEDANGRKGLVPSAYLKEI